MIAQRDKDIVVATKADWEKLRNCTILVTGASGRLGIYIAQSALFANEKYNLNLNVLLLARSRKKIDEHYGKLIEKANVHLIIQDITEKIETEYPIDFIFHTAGLASPSDFTYRPIETIWGHVQGTKNVLDLAVEKKTKRVLYVSTVEIYGDWNRDVGIKETDMGPLENSNFRACYP